MLSTRNNQNSSEVSEEPMPKRHKSSSDRVRKDLERAKKDEKDLDPSLSDRGAATIYRDNTGTYALKIFYQIF
jgi:hypothetical protein